MLWPDRRLDETTAQPLEDQYLTSNYKFAKRERRRRERHK
jgi:hypothetical protein